MDVVFRNVRYPDFESGRMAFGHVGIQGNRIAAVGKASLPAAHVIEGSGRLLTPGLMDAHVHIESSLLTPARFGQAVAREGTLLAVADCHEIANVAGLAGLQWFMDDADAAPMDIRFAVPSCVPASPFGTSGGSLGLKEIQQLLSDPRVVALGEVMNIPAVLNRDPVVLAMIDAARTRGKVVNGHAPGLSGVNLARYHAAGIDDDHETGDVSGLQERLDAGMHVFIRQGSAERSDPEAYRLLASYPDRILFCTDDRSLCDIRQDGHLQPHLRLATEQGVNPVHILQAACLNGPRYYGIQDTGAIRVGFRADLVLFDGPDRWQVDLVMVGGQVLSYSDDLCHHPSPDFLKQSFRLPPDWSIPQIPQAVRHLAIGVTDGSLVTDRLAVDAALPTVHLQRDLLKLVVLERYGHGHAAACRVHGFGLKRGALASSVAHDCHNIVAVGVCDEAIRRAVQALLDHGGGLSVVDGTDSWVVPLPVGGIVSDDPPEPLAAALMNLSERTHRLGSCLRNPHATLSFMALEVIPHLKLTDRGLFDVDAFDWVGVHEKSPRMRAQTNAIQDDEA